MRRASTRTGRYSSVAIAFHWAIAAMVLVNLWIGLVGGSMSVHKAIGITVLVLTAARVLWRLGHRPPPLPPMPLWQRAGAHLVHGALYALLILLPLSGWAMVSGGAVRRPLTWFGLFDLPYMPNVPPEGAAAAHSGHEVFGFAMLGLVALHVAAAMYHQFIARDRLIDRMMPALDR